MQTVNVVGAGLAGCEIALQLASRGVRVRLFEMKPDRRTPAQCSDHLAELVCSNSFRSANVNNAIGLLKWEMQQVGSQVMEAASVAAVPAGDALAVDRDVFGAQMTQRIEAQPNIELVRGVVETIPDGLTVICTGPLTDETLAAQIATLAGRDSLYFYDAIAPILDADSIDWDVVWRQSRYDKGEGADYANAPMSEAQYFAFIDALNAGEKVEARDFEALKFFEGCLPIEVMAERGPQTLAHGPMKPVGLTDPRTGKQAFAVVQLRMENQDATAWNMVGFQTRLKYGEQRRIFRSIPGLENAVFLRHGSVHRNTYIESRTLLDPKTLHWKDNPNLYFAGQITGVEGYVESTACGLLVAFEILARLKGTAFDPPPTTCALGALRRHITGDGLFGKYVPSNLNWSLFAPIDRIRREKKREKRARMSARGQADMNAWWRTASAVIGPTPSPQG